MTRGRKQRVGGVDIAASALARISPRALRPGIDRLRLDTRAIVDGFRGGGPAPVVSRGQATAPVPLSEIDPIEHVLPRPVRARWVALRTDLRWLARDLRGEKRPAVVPRVERPAAQRPADATLAARPLRVEAIERETDAAVTVRLADPSGAPIAFAAGQFLSFELTIDGRRVRRAYSLSSSPLDGPTATVTVKRVEGGLVSHWFADSLEVGARLDVRGPSGHFVARDEDTELVLIAGGSGITPIVSIVETALRARPDARVRVLYGNRRAEDILFAERLRALAAAHPARMSLTLALEEPPEGWTGLTGRLDASLVGGWLDAGGERAQPRYFLCGPTGMMGAARAAIEARGTPSDAIAEERFQSPGDPGAARDVALPTEPVSLQLRVDGRDRIVPVRPGQTLLEAGIGAGAPMPFSCTMGGCAACKCKLVSGQVHMDEPNCLSAAERADGWVLACCSRPLGPVRLEVSR